MKFGIFLPPLHRIGENPTLALDRDIDLIQHLDHLGFDEAWIGEHHSAGWELISDPALVIASVAPRTRSIRLGTGVTSLPYHHPMMVADRMVQLDHMTRGRAMLGVGPGALPSDAHMLGVEQTSQRQRMAESLEAIMALLTSAEPVNMETDWFTLRDARLQLNHYTSPHLPVAATHSFSPAGPRVAGRFGVGMLSVASFQPGGITGLKEAWRWAEEAAAEAGKTVSREHWRVVIPFHLAEDGDQAREEARKGIQIWNAEYRAGTLGRRMAPEEESVDGMIRSRGAIIGTPEDAIETIESILEISGGFGGVLGLAHEWASWHSTCHSYELWARYVAPHFQHQLERPRESRDWVAAGSQSQFKPPSAAVRKAFTDSGVALPEGMDHPLYGRLT